ncbi:hypothetical protein CDD82_7189 [Ophiocordyceps australis]|uniref:Roadblock/LAMTOR2 domain-containing protein n=1 Tax=Ophiocordyceps australis TaxID=1399860 RepID=A0A2C5ZRT2_9HYPO|nr:hypothetical protein CDD82_7189 [Ophiocordyceps australis]
MADSLESSQANGQAALDEKLDRLAKKPGVKACIVLDRKNGNVLKTSGDISALRTVKESDAAVANPLPNDPLAEENRTRGVDDFAAMIWSFVSNAGQLVHQMNAEVSAALFAVEGWANARQDDIRHVRLRTKNQEITIVLDPKYLLTAILHASPA